jgi:DNA-binding NarL/FixJ family response regulator
MCGRSGGRIGARSQELVGFGSNTLVLNGRGPRPPGREFEARLKTIRIVIADDHPLFREALRGVLAGSPGLVVVGEAADGKEALALCAREKPQILILDAFMPRVSGYEVLERLPAASPATRVLIFTGYLEGRFEEKTLAAGAKGFLGKDAPAEVILRAVRAVADGEVWATRVGTRRLLGRVGSTGDGRLFSALTPREREILGMLGRGWSTKPIASRTGLSEKTVSVHISHVIEKLGVRGRIQAALLARQYADLEPEGLLEDKEAP